MPIQWVDQVLSSGVEEVDNQHKELIRKINGLVDAIRGGEARQTIGGMLAFLAEYAGSHFSCEERHFARLKCSPAGCAANRAAHKQFLKDFTAIKSEFDQNGVTPRVQQKLCNWMMNWLIQHIQHVDVNHLRAALGDLMTSSTR